ncbi:hypothetical protein [Mycobacterium asiaticum]|uniref:ESX-1 secretion-associated protein EspJ n=1 Tax=Mycobacterium asiaticum TaxID=1790 RepID=A0A1A3NFP3_MYCAS|nr:hypothetical protein [Mycobacterium asiaticum]OBK20611.1 hypothetical protein A5635_24755 [Mycobacterium asiaticum]
MVEPLAVDPARLVAAASKLTELVFPTPPSPIAATGSDAVSGAINETMPAIESLVTDGMPGVTAALKRTATSMGAAADIYTKADQSLGQALTQYAFGADGQSMGANALGAVTGLGGAAAGAAMLGGPAAAAQQLAGAASAGAVSQVGAAVGAQAEALSPRIAATVPQLVQLAPMAQQMAPMGQQVGQSVQQAASQAGQGGGAQLASDTKPADEDKKDDEENPDADGSPADGAPADGAAAGKATLVSAPVEGSAGGKSAAGPVAAPI